MGGFSTFALVILALAVVTVIMGVKIVVAGTRMDGRAFWSLPQDAATRPEFNRSLH